jgi:hypothetical protein
MIFFSATLLVFVLPCPLHLIISRLCEGGKIRANFRPVYTDQDQDLDQDQDPDLDKDPDPDPDPDLDTDLDQDLDQDQDPDLDKDPEIFCLRDRFISYYIQIV